eukprot:SAG11_NODE_37583_length_256_cov_0.662420_1_plen_65_part_01
MLLPLLAASLATLGGEDALVLPDVAGAWTSSSWRLTTSTVASAAKWVRPAAVGADDVAEMNVEHL